MRETGFDEFNSGTYGAITFAALLNLVDFAEEELASQAAEVCDMLLRMTARHCFHGTTQFEPGVYGYQQNLWYAALAQDLAVFSNHPGQSCEAKTSLLLPAFTLPFVPRENKTQFVD